ncbi:MAG: PstS family phosphate ABC transporter substrate-binding protein [Cyanophyceae cyanobacterium]
MKNLISGDLTTGYPGNLSINRSTNPNCRSVVLVPQKFTGPFKIAIAASTLAFAGSIYGLVHTAGTTLKRELDPVYSTLTEVQNVPQGVFIYGGATTFAPLRSPVILAAINEAHPRFYPVYTESMDDQLGSAREIQRLLADQISFAESSRSLRAAEKKTAQRKGFELAQIPVAWDGIAFFVHPELSIPGLTLSQISLIYTGKVSNWEELGGPNLPITPYSLNPPTSGTASILQEAVLAGEFGATVEIVENTTLAIRQVAQTPGGIGYASAAVVVGQETVATIAIAGENGKFVSPATSAEVNTAAFADGSYPLTRKLYVVVKRDGSVDEQAGNAYANLLLSTQGQQLIEQVGFAPYRDYP